MRDPKNKQLGRWVANQRAEYHKMIVGKPNHIKKERIELLNDLGFVWKDVPNPCQYKTKVTWEERLQQLIGFKTEFDHTNVSKRYAKNKPLGTWVATQRAEYKKMKEVKPSQLTEERSKSLNKLGFVWKPPRYNKKVNS